MYQLSVVQRRCGSGLRAIKRVGIWGLGCAACSANVVVGLLIKHIQIWKDENLS